MHRSLVTVILAALALVLPATATASRTPTRTERIQVARSIHLPRSCTTVRVSTVSRRYASWTFKGSSYRRRACRRYASNGTAILRRHGHRWRDVGGSSDCIRVRHVPRRVWLDLRASYCR